MNPFRRMCLSVIACIPFASWSGPAKSQGRLPATPPQPEGPFYPREFPGEIDADLRHYRGLTARGTLLDLHGRMLHVDGSPLTNAVIEIWQCDTDGEYRYDAASMQRADSGFQGFGKSTSDNTGAYRFTTIRPVPYSGRPPHIHMRVKHGHNVLLTTQMYIKGDGAEKDPFIMRLPDASRKLLLAELVKTPHGLSAQFDIVIAKA
jgi:protocatechuate 3,4-dioxygenase beta subunit